MPFLPYLLKKPAFEQQVVAILPSRVKRLRMRSKIQFERVSHQRSHHPLHPRNERIAP
jgi:hypothetical protein